MVLRGLIIAACGFLVIFSPGLPIGLLTRRSPFFKRELLYWGIGLWFFALLPSLFFQSLLRQLLASSLSQQAYTGKLAVILLPLLGLLMNAVFLAAGMAILLRRQRVEGKALPQSGLALGFGVGLLAQVFTGLSLVAGGFRLMFGEAILPVIDTLKEAGLAELLLSLLPLILFRPANLLVSAVQGVLVSRSIGAGARPLVLRRTFWLAVLVNVLFSWVILAVQQALGVENPGQVLLSAADSLPSALASLYYLLAALLAYRWLTRQMAGWEAQRKTGRREARATKVSTSPRAR